jgi:hypothetical protein
MIARFDNYQLGKSTEELVLDTSEEVAEVALAMARQCRRTLDICSRHLDPKLYEHGDFVEAIRQLARRSSRSRIRLIVLQPEGLHRRGHPLINLAGTLSSFIEVRVPGKEHKDFNEAILIADETGYIHRPRSDRFETNASFCSPARVGALVLQFNEIWEKGGSDPNFRRFSL